MAFQVTQCPKCESTFNTDLRLLDLAAGKVRCGACLAVFQAEENFLLDEEDPSSNQEAESVFVGSDPEDFFDPAVFLTRRSLQETTEIHTADTQAPHLPEYASQQTQNSIIQQQSAAAEEPSLDADQNLDLDSTEASTSSDEPADPEDSHLEFFAAVNESLEQVHEFDGIEDLQTIAELNALDNPNADMFTSPRDQAGVNEEISELSPESDDILDNSISEEEMEAVLAGELDEEDQNGSAADSVTEETEALENSEPVELDAIRSKPDPKPEDITLSISFAVEPQRGIVGEPQREGKEEPQREGKEEPQREENQELQKEGIEEPEQNSDEELQASPSEDPQQEDNDSSSRTENAAIHRDHGASSTAELPADDYPETSSQQSEELPEDATQNDPAVAEYEQTEPEIAEFNQAIEDQEFNASIERSESHQISESSLDMELEDLESEFTREENEREELGATVLESEEVDTSTEAIRARALKTQYQDDDALGSIPQANLQALDTMTPPVELSGRMPKSWGRRLALGILSLLLAGGLAGQYTWREIDQYAQEPATRQIFERICAELACELPNYSNIDAIVSNNLTVRSHPDREDGLVVAFEIRNTAQFPQAFPILILSFNTPGNDVIALREFAPDEYLDPGLRDIEEMPVLAPVQIGLEIVDPGGDAMNYTMAFRSP